MCMYFKYTQRLLGTCKSEMTNVMDLIVEGMNVVLEPFKHVKIK